MFDYGVIILGVAVVFTIFSAIFWGLLCFLPSAATLQTAFAASMSTVRFIHLHLFVLTHMKLKSNVKTFYQHVISSEECSDDLLYPLYVLLLCNDYKRTFPFILMCD